MNKVPFKGYGQVALTPCFLRAGCPYSFSFTGRMPVLLFFFYGQVALIPFLFTGWMPLFLFFYGQDARTPFLFLRAGCPYSFYYITGRMPVLLFSWL